MKILKKILLFITNTMIGVIVCFLCYKEAGYLHQIKNIIVKENKNTNTLRMAFLDENKIIKEIKIDEK